MYTHDIDIRHVFKYVRLETKKINDKDCSCLTVPEIFEGEWVQSSNISPLRKYYFTQLNMKYRRKINTSDLIQKDGKCGTRNPVGSVQSQCNATSSSPCCNEIKGECGNGKENCDCLYNCVNYKTLVQAEFMEWKDKHCPLKEFDAISSCEFLQSRFSSITFIGDSLVRHMFSALLIHLTDDLAYGALRHNLNATELSQCKYGMQFADRICRLKLAVNWKDIQSNPRYCAYNDKKIKVRFVEAFVTGHSALAKATVGQALREERPLIVVGIGIHNHFVVKKVWKDYLEPIMKFLKQKEYKKPFFIWLGGNANGPLKSVVHYKLQKSERAVNFTNTISNYLRAYNATVFDNFKITNNVHSFDGTHFGQAVNLLKIRMLIKLLKRSDRFL